ncbi:putative holin-like toxin [Proteiniborus sp.]
MVNYGQGNMSTYQAISLMIAFGMLLILYSNLMIGDFLC